MVEQIALYTLLLLAICYVAYRFYASIKKKQACDKCELMKAVKEQK